ncbi:unnamed protein product [Calicophoron daubneyi]|uniref:E3 ubiquitin-protein ligase TRIM9 n=1 Tax=Calicophoron daubneyi TaxID=300641 RepID=A0AAV2TGS9_CALDB
MIVTKLKSEINCPVCHQLFQGPLLLPCGHSVCSPCANKLWFPRDSVKWPTKSYSNECRTNAPVAQLANTEDALSEADSGVVVCGAESSASLNNSQCANTTVHSPTLCREPCPVCMTVPKLPSDVSSLNLESNQTANDWWPKNVALENLIIRLSEAHPKDINTDKKLSLQRKKPGLELSSISSAVHYCQLCDVTHTSVTSFCEQCRLWYCTACLAKWHPQIGMLSRHQIRAASHMSSNTPSQQTNTQEPDGVKCLQHPHCVCTLYCVNCAKLVCVHCLKEDSGETEALPSPNGTTKCFAPFLPSPTNGVNYDAGNREYRQQPGYPCDNSTLNALRSGSSHIGHVICSTENHAKKCKIELTRMLQTLSEKAKRGADIVQELKNAESRTKGNIQSMESAVNQEIDQLIRKLEDRRTELLERVRSQMQQRGRQIREQTGQIGARLSATTSLLHYGVELIKEQNAAAFIQVVPSLTQRLTSCQNQFTRELELCQTQPFGEVELRINTTAVAHQIDELYLGEHNAPPTPKIVQSECLVDGNALHIVWLPFPRKASNIPTNHPAGTPLSNRFLHPSSISQQQHQQPPSLPQPEEMGRHPPPLLTDPVKMCNMMSWVQPPTCPSRSNSSAGIQTSCVVDHPPPLPPLTPDFRMNRNVNFPASVSAYMLSDRELADSCGRMPTTPHYSRKSIHPSANSSFDMSTSQSVGTLYPKNAIRVEEQSLISSSFSTAATSSPAEWPDGIRYFLEVDNGRGGHFKVAYQGPEMACRLEGLQFNTAYRLRVRAANRVGYSAYSELVTLRTSRLAKFRMDPTTGPPPPLVSLQLDPSAIIVSAVGEAEDRVLLADVGFSQGIHYWEWQIEAYDGRGQPSFGVALSTVSKDRMLGLDKAGWAMYLNGSRSWFVHAGQHHDRTDGGISVSNSSVALTSQPEKDPGGGQRKSGRRFTTVGVRLDCDQGQLGFYLNGEPHGPVAFNNLTSSAKQQSTVGEVPRPSSEISGCESEDGQKSRLVKAVSFYPALSLSYYTRVRLITGLEVPSESEESSDSSEAEYDVSVDVTAQSDNNLTATLSGRSSTDVHTASSTEHGENERTPALARSSTIAVMNKVEHLKPSLPTTLPSNLSSVCCPQSPMPSRLITFGRN